MLRREIGKLMQLIERLVRNSMGAFGGHDQERLRRTLVRMLCLLFLVTFPVACRATLQEGNVLVDMMQKWKVNFVSWTAGTDPCQASVPWEDVQCTGSAVTSLLLANKGLQGYILPEIGQLTSLTFLDLGNNAITGEIPNEFSGLTRLQVLNFTSNPLLTGFPTVLVNMVNLQYLQMDHANLTGEIPESVQSLQNLVLLYLGDNDLTGALPAGLSKLSKLQTLSLWGNAFTAVLPSEWGKLGSLIYLNLHDCRFEGGLPSTWSSITNLKTLNLKNNLLTGHIPDSWRSLISLQELDLQQNFLSGPLPSWLFTLPAFRILYIQQNQLQSSLPTPLQIGNMDYVNLQCNYFTGTQPNISGPFNASILKWNCFQNVVDNDPGRNCQRQVDCNTFLRTLGDGDCPGCPPQLGPQGQTPDPLTCVCADQALPTSKSSIGAIIGGTLAIFLLVLTATVAFICWKRRLGRNTDVFSTGHGTESSTWEAPKDVRKFSYDELAKATNRFGDDHVIGRGGFGKVFCGTLVDGKKVAIKKASESSNQGRSEFHNEVSLLSRLHHRHLVQLEGFCEESGMQILVYEFMPNGNLHDYISGVRNGKILTWYTRLEIAVGVARGLEYLHSFANPPVIHRDVKPSNILLDDNFVAKVADFGISKATVEQDTHISTRPAGTVGFLDPEYFISRQLTTASDVYGFGVVLLELVTGQQAIDHSRDEFNLIEWARPKFESGGIRTIIAPLVEDDFSEKVYTAVAELALRCASYRKDGRPSMKTVLTLLESLLDEYPKSVKVVHSGSLDVRYKDDGQQDGSSDGASYPSIIVSSDHSEPSMVACLLPR